MGKFQLPRLSCMNWLAEGPLALYGEAYKQYLTKSLHALARQCSHLGA